MGRGILLPEQLRFFRLTWKTDSLFPDRRSLLRLLGKRISEFRVGATTLVSLVFFRFLEKRIADFLVGAVLLLFVRTGKSRKLENRAEQLFFARAPHFRRRVGEGTSKRGLRAPKTKRPTTRRETAETKSEL